MNVHYKTRALVLKKEDRGEADRVFTVFSQDLGRVELFAKSIRAITSKLKGGIEIFSLAELEFIQGKTRKTLIEASFEQKFSRIARTPEKLAMAMSACRAVDDFIKGQEADSRVWDLLAGFFSKLADETLQIPGQRLYYYFFWNFISALGYAPELFQCAICSEKLAQSGLGFSYKEGGVVCAACVTAGRHATRINPDIVKVLRLIANNDWPTLSRLTVKPASSRLLKKVSDNYYRYLAYKP